MTRVVIPCSVLADEGSPLTVPVQTLCDKIDRLLIYEGALMRQGNGGGSTAWRPR